MPLPYRGHAGSAVRPGFTLMEMIVVMAIIGIMAAIVAPRLRVSSKQRVRAAAVQLGQDLDLVRTRALASRRAALVVFDPVRARYDGYLARAGATTFAESAAEQDSMGVIRGRSLPEGVSFGRGDVADVPGYSGGGGITLPGLRAEFNSRGLPEPFGTSGVVYLSGSDDATVVAAVVLTAGGSLRVLVHDGAGWR